MTRKTKERGDMILRETIRAPMQMCCKHRVLAHASRLGSMTTNAVWLSLQTSKTLMCVLINCAANVPCVRHRIVVFINV